MEDCADAAAIGVNTWEAIGREELMPGGLEAYRESPTYSHGNFTVLPRLSEERTTLADAPDGDGLGQPDTGRSR